MFFLFVTLQFLPVRLGPHQFACPICSKIMETSSKIKRHILIHTGERPYSCQLCDYKCNQNSTLQDHYKRKHNY